MRVVSVIGFQNFASSALASAVACSSTPMSQAQTGVKANAAQFSVGGSSGAVRWRDDGTAPTGSSGIRIASGSLPYLYQGDLQKLQFIADAVAGNADMNVSYVLVAD